MRNQCVQRSVAPILPFALRQRLTSSPILLQRRFASDVADTQEAQADELDSHPSSADSDDHSTISSAISSAASRTSTATSNAAQSASDSFDNARNSVSDAASAAAAGASLNIGGSNLQSSPVPSSNTVYLGNLFFSVTAEDLKAEMESFGEVASAKVVFDRRGLSKGIGFVEFVDPAAAERAINEKNGQIFQGRALTVQYAVKRGQSSNAPRNPPSRTLFIGNLAFDMSDKDLNELFHDIRNVVDVRVAIDRRTGQPRGFAHADFVDAESAVKGMELLESKGEVHGRRLRLDFSTCASVPISYRSLAGGVHVSRDCDRGMSFLGGAECSTAGNPLSQFTKHVQDDKSLQRDRLVGRGPGGLQESMRTRGIDGVQDKMLRLESFEMMDDFLQQSGQDTQGRAASPFAMEQMRRELENYQTSNLRTQNPQDEWAHEFSPQVDQQAKMKAAWHGHKNGEFAPSEYAHFQHLKYVAAERAANPGANTSSATMHGLGQSHNRPYGMNMNMNMGMGGIGMGVGAMQRPSYRQPSQAALDIKGKGRMIELDDKNWEEQFAQIDGAGQRDLDTEANAAMEGELEDMDRSVLSETNEYGDFESIWKGIQAETATARNMVDNENIFRDGVHMGEFDQWDGFEGLGTHGGFDRDENLGDYLFEEDNIFKDVGDPFGEGVRIMEEGGNLSLAALAFEAAVQRDTQHVEAWSLLGSAQAQNEKESPAIRALERALTLDPSNLPALMGLAVSYTNEGYDSTAYRTLERWLSTKYPSIVDPSDVSSDADIGFTDRHRLHEKVTNHFIQAAQMSPDGEHMDPDVQVGLGVLFYGAEEYEKAVDCFSAALASTESGSTNQRQQVHLLWNRLGATLANSGRSEEAIAAYEKALTLNPNFVRARYNLGVSCINIGCYEEAAQHLLGALAMHGIVEAEGRERAREVVGGGADRGGGGPSDADLDRMMSQNQSTNLYDTLRRVFGQMGRKDLSDMVVPGMDVEPFRREFDF
ncbi:MAG: Peroxisomal membrane signal receptor PTS1 [Sclerophora amabilis]|nr:MAG: Peroxisomal membrane signal receptor PTS1 [Sclerophora amabilis]